MENALLNGFENLSIYLNIATYKRLIQDVQCVMFIKVSVDGRVLSF